MDVCQSEQPILDSTFCSRLIESVRKVACVIGRSRWDASHYIACGFAPTSMVRLEVVTLWAPLSSCTVLPPFLSVNPQPDRSLVAEPSVLFTMPCGLLLASTSICASAFFFFFFLGGGCFFPACHSRQCVPRFSDIRVL